MGLLGAKLGSMLAQRAPLGTLVPGAISEKLSVPKSIERPEYLFHDGPEVVTASDVKDAETIERIRRTSKLAAQALEEVLGLTHGRQAPLFQIVVGRRRNNGQYEPEILF